MIQIKQSDLEDFCKKNDIGFLGMFGSGARGDFRASSDVDLLIRYNRPKGLFEHSGIALELEEMLGRKLTDDEAVLMLAETTHAVARKGD